MSRNNKDTRRKNILTDVSNNRSLGNLSKLIRESAVFGKDFSAEEDDEVIEVVWKLLSDKRERSVFEITQALKNGATSREVEVAINVLRNEGKLTARRPNGSGFLYTIKPGVSSPAVQSLGTVKHLKVVDALPSRRSDYTILAEEGLDMCIWKLMSDLRFRKIEEIGSLLHEHGISSLAARNRVAILVRRGWFSRSGTGKRTEYGMKRGTPMPTIEKPEVVKEEPKVNSTTTVRERLELPIPKPPTPTVSASLPQPPTEVQVKQTTVTSSKTNTAINVGDTTDQAIWKVMSDGKGWSVPEVALLLEDYGFKSRSLSARFSNMFSSGKWFTRVEDGHGFRYTMLPGVPMPGEATRCTTARAEAPKAPLAETQPQLFQEPTIAEVAPLKETIMPVTQIKAVPPVEAPKRSFKESSMLSFRATIKGADFTFEQVKLLLEELVKGGYGQGKVSMEPSKFLTTQHKIRDKLFTDAELETLTLELLDAGFSVGDE